MKLTHFTAAILAASSQALAADLPTPPLPPWYPLKGWEISTLTASHPSTTPYGPDASSLVLTISNPSLIPALPAPHASGGGYVAFLATTARCELHWKTDAETPYGHSFNSCVADADAGSYSRPSWTVTLNELHTDLPNPGDYYLSISFELALNATVYGTLGYKRMTAGTTFRSGANLEGQCEEGADGLCEYALLNETAPVLIQPTLQECKSACG